MDKQFKAIIVSLVILVVLITGLSAQIYEMGSPKGLGLLKSKALLPGFHLAQPDTQALHREDRINPSPFRYAVCTPLNIDIKQSGLKEMLHQGYLWRYRVGSEFAYSVGVFFNRFWLPKGATLFLYNNQGSAVMGAFTSVNNNPGSSLQIADFKGKELIVEYFEPFQPEFEGELVIGEISQAYKDLYAHLGNTKAASDFIDINCDAGEEWQDVKHAVCKISFSVGGYRYVCSGALINNTRNDGTPYFLTANHCISTTASATSVIGYFNYENKECNGTASTPQALAGASLIATGAASDFTLLKFYKEPPSEYQPYYAGWDLSAGGPAQGTCIHHPQGGLKKIAIDDDPINMFNGSITWDGGVVTPSGTHWAVSYDLGTTTGGSSGAPLFTSEKRIVGQLHGHGNTSSYFGMLNYSWNKSSNPQQQLKYWLDPDNTGALKTDAFFKGIAPEANFSSEYQEVCVSAPVKLVDKSLFNPQKWEWSIAPSDYAFTEGTSPSSQQPVVLFKKSGSYSITLSVENDWGSTTKTRTNYVHAVTEINPVATGIPRDSVICGCDLKNYKITVTGAPSISFKVAENAQRIDTVSRDSSIYVSLKDEFRQEGDFSATLYIRSQFGSCTALDTARLKILLPKGDDLENATALEMGANGPFSNRCASLQGNEPVPPANNCFAQNSWCSKPASSNDPLRTIWFMFTAPPSGEVGVETKGSDTQIAIYEANSEQSILTGNYALVAANDDQSVGNLTSYIRSARVTPGRTYWIQLNGGKNGIEGDHYILLYKQSIEVFPNPAHGAINLRLNNRLDEDIAIRIFNGSGMLVLTQYQSKSNGLSDIPVDISRLSPGLYFLSILGSGYNDNQKIMIY